MSNLYLVSENEDFKNDLAMQIAKFVPEITICSENPDIVLVDEDYKEYVRLRSLHPVIPMLFLSADKRDNSDVLNINLAKPFVLGNLFDILRAANNKLDNSSDGYLVFGDYELHPNTKEIVILPENKKLKLTEKEVEILKFLYKNRREFISRNVLQKHVWKYNEEATTHTVETHIYRLRRKVEKQGVKRLILTENGCYKLNMD